MKDRVNHFMRLSQLGYRRLVPIVPPDAPLSENSTLHKRLLAGVDARGKAPGVKGRHGWRSYDWLAAENVQITEWHEMGAGVGIKTGRGLVAIDADTYDKGLAKIIKTKIEEVVGHCPPLRIGQYPKGLYIVRTDEDFVYSRIEFGERDEKGRLKERVEILAEGRQFVAVGVHPKTLEPYDWVNGLVAYKDLPFVPAADLHRILNELRPLLPAASEVRTEGAGTSDVDQETLRGDPELVERAVKAIANTSEAFPTRESYLDVGYAIKAAIPDDPQHAFEIFADWCARWQDGENPHDVVQADWDRMKPPFRRGAQYLFELAEQSIGQTGSFTAAQWFETPSDYTPLFPENSLNLFEPGNGAATGQPPKLFSFTPLASAAADALTGSAKPLVKGLLDQGAMSVLYGESNAGKTFMAMDIAYHVANALPWAGRKTAGLPVLYIAAEGGQGARKRAAALATRYGAGDGKFLFLMHPVNLLRADADLRPLLASIAACRLVFGLVVIDTLSRAMAGGDENASTDMGAMVKHLDVLRAATGAHVMAVHHSGKDRAKGARGHSLLRAATDTEIEVADRVISATKQRDLDGSFASAFVLDVVTLGVDGDGDPVTSCTVRLVSGEEAATAGVVAADVTPREREILDALRDLDGLADGAVEGVTLADLCGHFGGTGDAIEANAMRQALKRLVGKRCVKKVGRNRWQGQNVHFEAKKVVGIGSTTFVSAVSDNNEMVESGRESGRNVFS